MFALDGDVLQHVLREEDVEDQQSAASTPDEQHGPSASRDRHQQREGGSSHGNGAGNERHGIIQDLPAGIRLSLMSDAESKTLPGLPLPRPPTERTAPRKGIPPSYRISDGKSLTDSQRYEASSATDGAVETQELTPLESRRVVSEPQITPLEGIPGLNPPPAFQERFKYIVCSSGLLKERPNFEGRKRSPREDATTQRETPDVRISLAGLGIQDVSYEHGDDERAAAEPGTTGLRRRKNNILEPEPRNSPASFRRPSSSYASASVPSTPVFPSPDEHQSYTGWRFLAYTPFVRALSPYTEPIVLLLSSALWMFQIVGWIWLEILAVGAIVLCGFTNIIVKMSTEEKRSRSRARSRKSRRPSRDSTKRETSIHRTVREAPTVQLDQTANIRTAEPPTISTPARTEQANGEAARNVVEHDESAALLPPAHLETLEDALQGRPEATSLQGLALETLQTVVKNAEEMDEVIGNALTVIGESDRSPHYAGNETRTKRLRESLHTAFTNLNNHLSETYNSLAPLVSSQELRTLEVMYGVAEDNKTAAYQSPSRSSSGVPFPLRSPLMRLMDVDNVKDFNRLSTSEYSTTSTSVEDENSFEREETERTTDSPARGGTIVKRNRSRSSLTYHSAGVTTPSCTSQQAHGFPGPASTALSQDRFSPLPARSPRLAQRSTTNLRRASSLKEKASSGTIRPTLTDASGESDQDASEVRRLRYNWRYPSTLKEESESSQSLLSTDVSARTEATIKSPLAGEGNASDPQVITIPVRPKGQLRELRLSQSGIGLNSQSKTPPLSSSLSPHFGLSRTPDDQQDSGAYFQLGKVPGRASPMRLHRKRSSLQSLRYRNPDGTTVIASSPARHHRSRSSLDTTQGNLERFIGSLPPSMVNGLRGQGRSEVDNRSDRSSRISDRNSLPGVPRPASSTGYTSSPVLPTFLQPQMHRSVSYGHLTGASLKATLLAVHLKRKRVACALLALDFSADDKVGDGPMHIRHIALAKYWADVQMILDELRQIMSSIAKDVSTTTSICKEARYEPFLPGRPHDSFAPRQSDQFVMLEQIHILSRLLAGAQNELAELKSAVEQGDKEEIIQQWDRLRLDLAAMIRTWEKGRTTASKTSLPLTVDAESDVPDQVPDFVRHWDIEDAPDRAGDDLPPMAVPEESSNEVQVTVNDDATNHLLDSTSASFLPPPGIEDVFEAVLDFPPARAAPTGPDGQKLSREERIRMAKLARETATAGNSKAGSGPSSGLLAVAAPTMSKNGQVMDELKSVIGEMKRRRVTAPPATEQNGSVR